MAYQLSTLVTKVQQKIRNTNYSTSEITNYLNDTQNDICNEYPQLSFLKTSQNYTVTASNSDITAGVGLPTDYSQAINLVCTTNGLEGEITYMDEDALDELYPDKSDTTRYPASTPRYWYNDGETNRIFPKPAAAYTFTLRYYKKPTELVNDSDVPVIPSQHGEVLVSGATYRVLQAKDNYDQAAIHQNKYDEGLAKLVVRDAQPQIGQVHIMPVNAFTRTGNF